MRDLKTFGSYSTLNALLFIPTQSTDCTQLQIADSNQKHFSKKSNARFNFVPRKYMKYTIMK